MQSRRWQRIALLFDMAFPYDCEAVRGVHNYVHPDKRWRLRIFPLTISDLYAQLLAWHPDGIIGHIPHYCDAKCVQSLAVPWVNCGNDSWFGEPTVTVDNYSVGRLAADHLLEKSVASFGFYGLNVTFAECRLQGFAERLAEVGKSVNAHRQSAPSVVGYPSPTERMHLEEAMIRWLRGLPRPAGVLFQTDHEALRIMEFCRESGIGIPTDILTIGVDNDEVLCEMAQPPLTTVASPKRRIGFEAAAILDRMLAGGKVPGSLRLPPIGIVERESTGGNQTTDPILRRALQFIYDNASDSIAIDDVANHVGSSRRVLERKFAREFGHSPRNEIEQVRLRRARTLLAQSDLSIGAISEKCGFRDQSQFSVTFRRRHGMTPREWREFNTRIMRRDGAIQTNMV